MEQLGEEPTTAPAFRLVLGPLAKAPRYLEQETMNTL